MTVQDLITKLQQFNPDLPICIGEYIGFIEADEETIKIEKKKNILLFLLPAIMNLII